MYLGGLTPGRVAVPSCDGIEIEKSDSKEYHGVLSDVIFKKRPARVDEKSKYEGRRNGSHCGLEGLSEAIV